MATGNRPNRRTNAAAARDDEAARKEAAAVTAHDTAGVPWNEQPIQPRGGSSFWSNNPGAARSSSFVDKGEREFLVETAQVFHVTRLKAEHENKYQGKPSPRWLLTLDYMNPGGERVIKVLSLGMNPVRDEQMYLFADHFDNGGEPVPAVLAEYISTSGVAFYAIEPPSDNSAADDGDEIPV